jgi:hypothetical protein
MRFRKLPKDRLGRLLRTGDTVRIVAVPNLKGMSAAAVAESRPVFRQLCGKTARIDSFNQFGMAWLNFAIPVGRYKGWHGVAIETQLLERLPNNVAGRARSV